MAAILLLGGTACESQQSGAPGASKRATGAADQLTAFTGQRIDWKACEGKGLESFQCGIAKMPLDYTQPHGRSIDVALARFPASDRAQRIGSLFLNPGGPGVSGLELVFGVAKARVFPPQVQERFDLVGFDPRGVSASAPIRCLDDKTMDERSALDLTPDTPSEKDALRAMDERLAAACQANSGGLLPHVGTENVARDVDVLRAVLGDAKLNYYGMSYGTVLGQTYAELFPAHVGRMILDSNVPAAIGAADLLIEQARGLDASIKTIAVDCAEHTSSCPLGKNPAEATGKLREFITSLDAEPVPAAGRRRPVSQSDAVFALAHAAFSVGEWKPFLEALTGVPQLIRVPEGRIGRTCWSAGCA